jgi:hypothetical protein
MLTSKIYNIRDAIEYTTIGLQQEKYNIELSLDAPKWLRICSTGGYCAYKNTIYVPAVHLQLVSSKFEEDRSLGTAKLMPWIMLIKDNNENVSFLTAIKSLFNLKYQLHYFIYEFLFLSAINHPFKDTIGLGFMISRRRFFIKLSLPTVQKKIEKMLQANVIK